MLKTSLPLTLLQAAELLGCCERKMRGLIASRSIPYRRVGRKILIEEEDVIEYKHSHRVEAKSRVRRTTAPNNVYDEFYYRNKITAAVI